MTLPTGLESFNKIYPLAVNAFKTFAPLDYNVSITDKVNAMIDYLNQIGALNNNVVSDWNKVMIWAMNDGLDEATTQSVNAKMESMLAAGDFDDLLQNISTLAQEQINLINTNQVAKQSDLNAINEQLANETHQRQEADNAKVSQINYDADKAYMMAQLQALTSGFGQSYPTLAALQTALPDNDGKNHVVSADSNWYFWMDGFGWTSGGSYPGDAAIKQINNVIGYALDRTRNLFDVNEIINDGYYISYTTGNLASNANFCATDYKSVDSSTQYQLYTPNEDNLQSQVAFYDNSKNYISGSQFGSFTTPSNAAYIRLSFLNAYKGSVVFSEGVFSKNKEYTPFYEVKSNKQKVLTLADFSSRTLGTDGETISNQYDTSFSTTLMNRATILYTRNNSELVSNDFVFGRCRVIADHDLPIVNIQVIGADGTYYNNIFRNLKANKEYRLFFNSGKFTNSSSTTQILKMSFYGADGSVTTTVNVDEVCLTTNHYKCWYDDDTKDTIPDFNTTVLTVGLDGTYHFCDISAACEFAKRMTNVLIVPITIFVRNGTYDIGIDDNMPYAIYKGANLISIIGESEDGVILQKTCTATKQGRIIDAGGASSIENMTLIQNVDDSFTSEYTDSRAYCIHLDGAFDSDEEYRTVARNLTCINYVNAPIGAGLRNNQKLIYDHCNLIYKANTGLNGAFYTHAPSDPTANGCSLVVDGCNIQHLANTGRAMLIDDVVGSLSYANIPCTFTRNAVYSQSGETVTSDFKTTHDIQPLSALNNVAEMNY